VLRAAVLAAFLLLPATAAAAGPGDLTVTRTEQLSPRLVEYGFTTPALAGETNVRIVLPAGYKDHPRRHYPVLYLLHGCCDADVPGSRAWTVHGEAEQATAAYPLIVVMPDGGRGGFYSDWYRNGLGGTPEWETYHLGELMPWVDEHFRTRARRGGRVIAGLSMGGYGAMKYAAEHPDRFVAAATFSGAVDLNQIAPEVEGLSALDGGTPGSVFGLRQTEEIRWRTQNPWDLADNLRGLQLTLRTGNGEPGPYDSPGSGTDPLESSVHDQTVALHDRLTQLGIPHVFDDYGPGHHAWPY
jgi:S-formylglutathione hydrolase FrmB